MRDNTSPLLDPFEVEAIQLFCAARVHKLIFGEHASVFTGTRGFNFSGIRDFESGDTPVKVDWAHSTTTLFSPLQVRECIEERSVDIVIAADISCSTRCGASSALIGKSIARIIATIGFSASILQDTVGLVLFGGTELVIEPPCGGRNHVERMVDLYQTTPTASALSRRERLAETIAGELRRTSLVVVASDFLFPDVFSTLREVADLKQPHDVFLVMADSAFAFELPEISAGWVGCVDSETGAHICLSHSQIRELPHLIRRHQDAIGDYAEQADLEVLRVPPDAEPFQSAIVDFFLERRLRRQ
ncbi:MAG: DUF58 domain-containing protein [Deltaproteobacteria bacterium]